jgi:hypothetical protein
MRDDLDHVERLISENRESIERQREEIANLKLCSDAKSLRAAEMILEGLEQHLAMLRERRNAVLHSQRRRPHAGSKSSL